MPNPFLSLIDHDCDRSQSKRKKLGGVEIFCMARPEEPIREPNGNALKSKFHQKALYLPNSLSAKIYASQS